MRPESFFHSKQTPAPGMNALLAAVFGFHFALTQFSYFFLLEVFLSSRALPFFAGLFFWLVGFLAGLNLRRDHLEIPLLGLGVTAYYAALIITNKFPYRMEMLPLLGICIALTALLPGYFFPYAAKNFRAAKDLFFHENNGFIAGILFSLLSAVFAGRWMLQMAPLAGSCILLGMILLSKGTFFNDSTRRH